MEFNDKWAHRGSQVDDNEYESTGYPMGLNVMATGHSYSVAFAEDIMFVTVDVRNESGDNWCAFEKNRYGDKVYVTDNDGNLICGDAMVMPDGTKLNHGKGFTYREMSMGFYMDADVVSTDIYGNFGVHTNNDDFMEYYWERFEVNDEEMLISMAMVYDYDFDSYATEIPGIVAAQLLDSPLATEDVDLDQDGITWESDIDGVLSTSLNFSITDLTNGTHTITFWSTDEHDYSSEEDALNHFMDRLEISWQTFNSKSEAKLAETARL